MDFVVLGQFTKVLTAKIFDECGGVIINGGVINLHNSDSVLGIMVVASLSLERQYLSNSSFLNRHIDMVASINNHNFAALRLIILFMPI